MLFVIGCCLELVLCTLSFFIATFYSQDWGYAQIFIERSVCFGNKNGWTLLGEYGPIYGIIIGIVIVTMITYLICFFTKHDNIIPSFVILITFVTPIVLLFYAISQAVQKGQFIKMGFITIGHGVNSGLTNFGLLFVVGSIVAFILVCKGLVARKQKNLQNPEKKTKQIIVKKKNDDVKYDDWKI